MPSYSDDGNDESPPYPSRASVLAKTMEDELGIEVYKQTLDIEILRMIGLGSVIVMLFAGMVITKTMMGVTVAAILIVFHIVPICLFLILNYYRVQAKDDPKFNKYKKANPILSSITFIGTLWFYMVFVTPDEPFGSDAGMPLFKQHYAPYMLWQFGMMAMNFEQSWYFILNDKFPFQFITMKKFKWISRIYFPLLLIYYVVYTAFVWSFLGWGFVKDPLWDTTSNSPIGNKIALVLMWGWNVLTIILPIVFSYCTYKNKLGDCKILFIEVTCSRNVTRTSTNQETGKSQSRQIT